MKRPLQLLVSCRRLEVPRRVDEHRSCAYCFGGEAEIRSGDRERFCSFRRGIDPTCFGFPETHGRARDG